MHECTHTHTHTLSHSHSHSHSLKHTHTVQLRNVGRDAYNSEDFQHTRDWMKETLRFMNYSCSKNTDIQCIADMLVLFTCSACDEPDKLAEYNVQCVQNSS